MKIENILQRFNCISFLCKSHVKTIQSYARENAKNNVCIEIIMTYQ